MKPSISYLVSLPLRSDRARSLRLAAAAVVVLAISLVLWVPVFAEDAGSDGLAIPPGQENLLLQMLGVGAPLAGCDLVDGQIHYTSIKATYSCDSNNIEYKLTHRSQAGPGATSTDQFAIMLTSGSPPRGFADALAAVVHAREGEFEWVWLGGKPN